MPRTLYLENIFPKKVGVFIPEHFQATAAIDLIVYFHGHVKGICETDKAPFVKKGMEYYWDTPLFKCLRDELDASKTNAILIAPTLDPLIRSNSPASYGNLNAAGKLDFLINKTLTQLKADETLPAAAETGNVILSGHSAGGLPMLMILETKNAIKPNIAECWGFECLYFGTDGWNAWLKANPNKKFKHFREAGAQKEHIDQLKGRSNFIDIAKGPKHCKLLKERWREAIDNSTVLKKAGGPVPPTS